MRFGRLAARAPASGDAAFLATLYLVTRPDLGALPVPRSVIEGIARHQQQLQLEDYARRYPDAESYLVQEQGIAVARLVLDRSGQAVRVVDLAVAPAARRRGIARELLTALQAGGGAIALRVRVDNSAARALYASLGFTVRRDEGDALELAWKGQNE